MITDMTTFDRDRSGRFATSNPEPAKANLNVRVSASLKAQVEAVAGNELANWLREAITEKLAREQDKVVA